ncbi:unnamed protein product [Blepharisma stoltei]|uniref:Uncharacterized protein n=1 Tax=Blepharisma stoltei TaxID=1481888 RepID=A0AAU9J622_9CILI|nr:unnamed protein product [Blepharisma stoltei]
MNSSNNEESYLMQSDQNLKLSFLREELIEMNYDVRLFTKFVEDLKRTNIDEWTFDELSDCIWAFKNKYKPGQTLEEVLKLEKAEKDIERELYEIINQKKIQTKENNAKNKETPPKPPRKTEKPEFQAFESSPKSNINLEENFIDQPDIKSSPEKSKENKKKGEKINTEPADLYIQIDEILHEVVPNTPQFSLSDTGCKFNTLMSDEDDIIAEIYGKTDIPAEIIEEEFPDKSLTSISAFNDSPRNLHSEQIIIENITPNPHPTPITMTKYENNENIRKEDEGILRYFQSFTLTLENFEEKLEKLSNKMIEIENKIDKNNSDSSEKSSGLIETVEVLSKEIEKLKKNQEASFVSQVSSANEIFEKISLLENKDKNRSKLLEEIGNENTSLRENSKDLELKIDKIEIDIKNQLKSFKNCTMSQNEINDIRESQSSINTNIENISSDLYHLNEEIIKLRNQIDAHSKSSVKISKLRADQEKFYNEIMQRIESIEEKEAEVKKIKTFTEAIKNDFHEKLKNLEEKLRREHENDPTKEATLYSISTLEKRMYALDEKLARELASVRDFSISKMKESQILEESKVISEKEDTINISFSENKTKKQIFLEKSDTISPLTISQLEKDHLSKPPKFLNNRKIKNEKAFSISPQTLKVKKIEEEKGFNEENELEPTRDLPVPIKKNPEESLNERIARLENLNKRTNTSEKASQSVEKSDMSISEDLGKFVPGETESILVNTILEKANKTRATENFKQAFRPTRGISPVSNSFKSFSQYSNKPSGDSSESLPSQELQEHLKMRGFKLQENRPFVAQRQKD